MTCTYHHGHAVLEQYKTFASKVSPCTKMILRLCYSRGWIEPYGDAKSPRSVVTAMNVFGSTLEGTLPRFAVWPQRTVATSQSSLSPHVLLSSPSLPHGASWTIPKGISSGVIPADRFRWIAANEQCSGVAVESVDKANNPFLSCNRV